ncbi:MAG: hypothetical protein CVT67_10415 [Actinobacteria bacterium HGW-Actinobacteria-7]|jgi:para-aminobenzoate synthetase/4-amino-4-deoxychorismate lyase|nr:MAG: hypothetical protein CVT67_10415 [Actinobacteria bacterium HGW-Actinobacteria-7]
MLPARDLWMSHTTGERLWPVSLTPETLALALPAERCPLVLSPSSERGWLGGSAVVAVDPFELRHGVTLAEAAKTLEAAYEAESAVLTAVLATYDGTCSVASYSGAFVRSDSGWRRWGPVAEALVFSANQTGQALDCATPLLVRTEWDLSGREYRTAVAEVRERIASGDVYVLNLTARLSGELAVESPARAFVALSSRAAGEMTAHLAGLPGETPWIASVSPERFVRVSAGEEGARVAEVCPIKGTRPRGLSPQGEAAIIIELAGDPKERAEHIMVVDLERNDLGVACVPGTIHVDPLYEVVPTPYCHQMVSTVRGTVRREVDFATLLSALFPCGSVTGAPKRAAMRIISELEASARRAYCGALLVAVPGELDSSVLIRTLEGSAEKPAQATWGTGCGITHDSDPAAEYLELLLKASPATGDGAPSVALRETMRVSSRRVPLLDRHLARLAGGGAGPTVLARVRAAVAAQLDRPEAALPYARLGITATPDGEVAAGLTTEESSLAVEGGPRIALVEVAQAPVLPECAAKPASRRYWDRAHRVARARGADQAILVGPDGRIIDGSTATVWLVVDGALRTPPAPPAVAGVARSLIFDLAAQHGLEATEANLDSRDLELADEVFLSNAVGLVVPVRNRGGIVCATLTRLVADLFV